MEQISPAELLKKHNCKHIEINGSRFILVGGTHSTEFGVKDGLKHYSQVKVFFDALEYDAICMECGVNAEWGDLDFDLKFFKDFVKKIRADKELWTEFDSVLNQISLKHPKFVKLFTGEEELSKGELEYCAWVLQKISERPALSEKNRTKLSEMLKNHLKQYLPTYINKLELSQLEGPERIDFNSLYNIFLLKAIKDRKDFVKCDILTGDLLFVLLLLQPVLLPVALIQQIPEEAVLLVFLLYILLIRRHVIASSPDQLNQKYRRLTKRIYSIMLFLISAPTLLLDKYREALTAFQLLNLAEDFGKKHKRCGTFIYFSHIGHTEGVFENLKLGTGELERKLRSKKFAVFTSFYREYLLLETSKLPLNTRTNFLNAAKKAGISPYYI